MEKRKACFLTPMELFRLDLACKPLVEAFGDPPYLVGSVLTRADYRDVDVRMILYDEDYDRLIPHQAMRTILDLAFTAYLQEMTGLSIDFQFQRMTEANAQHSWPRNPLGTRKLGAWTGDAPTGPVVVTGGEPPRYESAEPLS